jgi:hypothetical protein
VEWKCKNCKKVLKKGKSYVNLSSGQISRTPDSERQKKANGFILTRKRTGVIS